MRNSHWLRSVLTCCLFCTTAALAAGCGGGSDEDSSTNADTSDTRPAAGSSGSASSTPPERGDVTFDECLVETLGVFAVRPDGYSSACVNCLCKQSPRAVALCDDQANLCWSLIGCVAANCKGEKDMAEATCATAMCGQFIGGAGLSMAVGALLQGEECSADCPPRTQ